MDVFVRGVTELWGFKLRGSGFPQTFSAPSGEAMRQTSGARTCSRSSITIPSLVGLGFYPPPGWPKTLSFFCLFVCLCVCLFVRHAFCVPYLLRRRWSTETILMPLDREGFVVVHPCSTFSDCCQLVTPQNAEVQKTSKMGFFVARGRQNKLIETEFGMQAYTAGLL